MRLAARRRSPGWRVPALAALAVAGLAVIVGSGGGSGIDTGPPTPWVQLEHPIITVAVGSAVTLRAVVTDQSGLPPPRTYALQWCRWHKASSSADCIAIAGANGETCVVPPVNLDDDGDTFTVTLSERGASRSASTQILVSSGRAAVQSDSEFLPQEWSPLAVLSPAGFEATHVEERAMSGGNPDAYRRVTYRSTTAGGEILVFHARLASTYDPATQGPLRMIDFEIDCANISESGAFTLPRPMIEQSSRRFVTAINDSSGDCTPLAWQTQRVVGATPFVFWQVDGPACPASGQCPDFSAAGAPMRFGIATAWVVPIGGLQGPVVQGLDNWKVTLWRP